MVLITHMASKFTNCKLTIVINSLRRISYYSTTHTADAAHIIGGSKTKNVVAEFKNGRWARLKDLNKGRDSHGSINIGTKTMVIGGEAISGL